MKVLFFGRLKEITQKEEIEIFGISDLDDLKKRIFENFPKLKDEVFSVAVNQEIVNKNVKLSEDDEIAFLPPIAGG